MNKKQLEEIKNKLEESKKSLEETLEGFAQKKDLPEGDWETKYPKFEGISAEEKADEVEEYASLLPIEHSLELKLKKVNEALKKLEENNYGKCEKCHADISYEELFITPETKNCKNCS